MIVLLDMDGVLANFVGQVIRTLKLDVEHSEWKSWAHHNTLGISESQFWQATQEEGFWLDIDPYPWAHDLMDRLRKHFWVIIASSPSLDPRCSMEKKQWIRKHFPDFLMEDVVLTNHKSLMAVPGRILIDDSQRNVTDFAMEGGRGILFPAPWNELDLVPDHQKAWYASEIARGYLTSG